MLINDKEYEVLELDSKEELLQFSINIIAKSLMITEKTDPEIALLASYFISNKKKPDIQFLKNNFLTEYNNITTLVLLSEEWVIEIVKLVSMNKLTNFEDNLTLF
jgi:hypothetical protein